MPADDKWDVRRKAIAWREIDDRLWCAVCFHGPLVPDRLLDPGVLLVHTSITYWMEAGIPPQMGHFSSFLVSMIRERVPNGDTR